MTRVVTGARLHFGFTNLSLVHERLYGSLGVALERPRAVVTAERAAGIDCAGACEASLVERVVDLLDVPGAAVDVERALPRHVGLGSGTQHALAVLTAVARAYDRDPRARELAPSLGRGGRSGVGVATFERGGFVLDTGHPTARFTTDRPETGNWTVPGVAAEHSVPEQWRFVVVVPDVEPGRSGDSEDRAMRAVVERADPDRADRIAGIVTRRVLPAVAEGSAERFGEAVAEIGRLNGSWYADEQGGVYRPPVGEVVASLEESPVIYGAGQSSWGPSVYGITDQTHADAARQAGREALATAGVDGDVLVVRGRNTGARIE
jgi:beta-ribofuranosylaminobenzene 5'-phosphate synthase